MVSTRQCQTKFALGETVLCYEPDTTKAKVLYESKILEVDFTKDEKGRKVPEYFVHFSGWNKSWDRWVLEDQVLEGNEANRSRMKRLHEEALNSMKNKKKKKLLDTTAAGQSSNETVSPAITPPQQPLSPLTCTSVALAAIELEIPSSLKLKLEDDCYFIKRKKKLVCLPRSPNVRDILKQYIEHVTQQDMLEPQSSLQIVKEVMDGIRIYFDFTLPSLLLYNFERDQYEEVMGLKNGAAENGQDGGKDVRLDARAEPGSDEKSARQEKNDVTKSRKAAVKEGPNEDTKQDDTKRVLRGRSIRYKSPALSARSNASRVSNGDVSCDTPIKEEKNQNKGIKRKLKDVLSDEDEGAKKCSSRLLPGTEMESGESSNDQTPSMVYGAEHLLRLFVKLPSLLAKTTMQEHRLSLLLQQLTDFLQYLSARTNILFSQDAYQDILL